MADKEHPAAPRLLTDDELAPILRVSPSFLRRDRVTRQSIPFVRIGDRCLYELETVLAHVKASTVGGSAGGRRARGYMKVGG